MKAFVTGRRAASPAAAQQQNRLIAGNSGRQAVAANARVPVPFTNLSHRQAQQTSRPASQNSSAERLIRAQNETHSANTFGPSVNDASVNFSEPEEEALAPRTLEVDSQKNALPHSGHDQDSMEHRSQGDELEDEESPYDETEEIHFDMPRGEEQAGLNWDIVSDDQANEIKQGLLTSLMHRQDFTGKQSISNLFNGDDSYPTTTSGRLEEFDLTEGPFEIPSALKPSSAGHYPHQMAPHAQASSAYTGLPHRHSPARFRQNPAIQPETAASVSHSRQRSDYAETEKMDRSGQEPAHLSANTFPVSFGMPLSGPVNESQLEILDPSPYSQHPAKSLSTEHDPGLGVSTSLRSAEYPKQSKLIDYPEDELYVKKFTELQDEPFDLDPAQTPINIPELASTVPIHDRLRYAHQHMDHADQGQFFASLTLSEWEEAGDWFLDRLRDFIGRIAESRKQKRALAKVYEDEVSQRNELVARKRQKLEDSLSSMRTGGEVLLKTPGKLRTERMSAI